MTPDPRIRAIGNAIHDELMTELQQYLEVRLKAALPQLYAQALDYSQRSIDWEVKLPYVRPKNVVDQAREKHSGITFVKHCL